VAESMVRWILAFAVVAFPGVCLAQVNVEPLRARLDDAGFASQFDGSLSTKGGNKQKLAFGGDALVGAKSGLHLAYVNVAADYERQNRVIQEEDAFGHARYNLQLGSWFWWELFGQMEMDRFRRIVRRDLVGTGPRVGRSGEVLSIYYGTSYMPEWTLTEDDSARRLVHRWNNYTSLMIRAAPMTVSTTVYLQPRFDAFRDYHLLVVQTLGFKITKVLSSNLTGEIRYESEPPAEDVEPLDYAVTNALRVRF